MITKLKNRIFTDFNRHSLTMLSGTAFSQALPLIFSPVLARLYTPSEFGAFSLFFSTSVVLGSMSTGKFDLALYTAKSRENAVITFLSGITFTVFFLALIIIGCFFILLTDVWEEVTLEILIAVPLTVFLIGCSQSLIALSTREKKFKSIARSKIILGIVWVGINLLLGLLNVNAMGLILGYCAGMLISVVYLYYVNRAEINSVRFNTRIFKINLIRNRNYAFIFLPAHLLNAIASNGPAFFLSSFFGLAANGFYFKAARVGESPTGIIKNSLGNVFWQQASQEYIQSGSARKQMIGFLWKLLAIGFIPYCLAFIYADELFLFLFGAPWVQAAIYFKILAPYFLIQFLVTPLTIMIILSNKPLIDISWQIFFALCVVVSFSIGWLQRDALVALQWYSVLMSVMQLIAFGINYYYSVKR